MNIYFNKEKLIEAIDGVLQSPNSSLCFEDKQILEKVKEALKKAKTREEMINALKPLTTLFQLIKTFIDFFS